MHGWIEGKLTWVDQIMAPIQRDEASWLAQSLQVHCLTALCPARHHYKACKADL